MTIHNIGAEDALLSEDSLTRMIARAGVSTWLAGFQEWVNDEIKRGEKETDLLLAIISVQIMTHASVAANVMSAEGFPAMLEVYKHMLNDKWLPHARITKRLLGRTMQ